MIEGYEFGRMVIAGKEYRKDLTILGGEVRDNWWRKEGHRVDVADVEDVLAAKPEVLVIGKGAHGLMRVGMKLERALGQAGIEWIAEPTGRAVETFNRLVAEGRNVAAVFHLTC